MRHDDKFVSVFSVLIKNLDLSTNSIGSLTSPTFSFMPNLRILDLKNNHIAFISLDAFEGLGKLEKLDISFQG